MRSIPTCTGHSLRWSTSTGADAAAASASESLSHSSTRAHFHRANGASVLMKPPNGLMTDRGDGMNPEELKLKEREVAALESLARSQATLAAKSREGTAWQKFWYGGDGGPGARSRHMRMNY